MKNILFFIILFSILSATTIHIPEDYPTIQNGIDASVDGDTVLIAQGIYYENLILEKEIVLASHAINEDLDSEWLTNENITGTIISGAQEPSDPNKGSCLIIRGGGWNYGGNPQPEIIGLTFQDGDGTSMLIDNCGVINRGRSGGAILMYKAYPTIMYNRFMNNGHDTDNVRAGRGGRMGGAMGHYADDGVEFDEDRNFSSQNSNQNNNSNREIPDTLNIRNNYFENNASGDGENFYSHGYEGSINVSNSIFENIDCETNSVNEFVLQSIENEADYVQNEISGNCIESSLFYVSSSGDDNNDGTESEPLKTIGHALTLVKSGETVTTINLASGTYSPSTTDEKFPIVLPSNVHLIGGGPASTILDAEADEDNEAAVMVIKEVENVRVANLTITGGYSEGHGCTGGGGLLITANDMFNLDTQNGTNFRYTGAVIEDVIIEGNWSHNGGGLSIFRSSGSVINNVTIRDNACSAFGGGVFTYGSQISMTSVTITQNNNLAGTAQGGGIMMPGTGGTLDNMTITDNLGCCNGAGVWTNNSDWIMTNSIISGNHGTNGSALAMLDSEPTLINVTMSDNTSDGTGGALWSLDSSPDIRNCTITGNTALTSSMGGGAMWAMGAGVPSFTDCLISENTTPYGGGAIWAGGVQGLTLTRVTIADNSSSWNAAMFLSDAFDDGSFTPATLTNCTITGNSAPNGGTLRATYGGHYNVINSIVWDNNTPQSISTNYGTVSISYSDIDGGWGGWTNINSDPLFTDPGNGDYTLISDPPNNVSPCIDAGTADLDGDGTDDIDYVGDDPDMGAFELGGILGCTDSEAENFNPEANMDDGSCQYGPPEVTVSYNIGWNMVGLPFEVEDASYETLFPNAQEGTLYSFGTAYENQVELAAGNGYLLMMTSDDEITFGGTPIYGVTMAVTEGWNLFSGTSSYLSVDDIYAHEILYPGTVYGLDVNYYNPDTIEPGRGYWVRATEDGEITLGSVPAEFMMTIVLDAYPAETTWDLSGPEGEVGSGGPYSDPGGMVDFSATLVPGDYMWTIYDAWGDGICCVYGNGSYELMLDGVVIGTGGNFGGQESVNFTVGARNHVNSLTTTHLPDDVEYPDVKGDTPFVGNIDFITETIEYNVEDEVYSDGSAKQVSIMNRLESSNSMTFSSGAYSTELYFGVEIPEEEILSYSLPPTFPQMEFDVRFSDDTKLVPESGEIEVITQSEMITIEYDIKVDAGKRYSWVLTSENGKDYTLEGTGEITIPSVERFVLNKKIVIPSTFTLYQNFPNPFNPITTLKYDLPSDAFVTLSIYDMLGREVTQLVNTSQKSGFKSVHWDAKDSMGRPVSAGVYLYQIHAGDNVQTRKMVLLK